MACVDGEASRIRWKTLFPMGAPRMPRTPTEYFPFKTGSFCMDYDPGLDGGAILGWPGFRIPGAPFVWKFTTPSPAFEEAGPPMGGGVPDDVGVAFTP